MPDSTDSARAALSKGPLIPHGLGRSYGDSALAPRALKTGRLDLVLGFDEASGVLTAQAGLSLDEALKLFVPRGWFIYGTPGTRFVSLGGAVASDVHGKGHHSEGCFSRHVLGLDLLLADGSVRHCSPGQNAELFRATCGGMGLTGLILAVKLQLKRIASSLIEQTTLRAGSLEEVLEQIEATAAQPYSVAWIDCLAQGRALGRSVLTVGDFAADGGLKPHGDPKLAVPVELPFALVQPWTMRAFNSAVYHKTLRKRSQQRVHYEGFFYPLDIAHDWNRVYGKGGFTQYQFVLPKAAGLKGLRPLLERIAISGKGSSLAVLKVLGAANENLLSFPLEGYTLALDFKVEPGLFELLDDLDARVLDLGGRLYLAKDVHMSEATFKQSYPRWQEFQAIRREHGALGRFASLQSKRIGLD